MPTPSKFKHALQQWKASERLLHQAKDKKSVVKKITRKIKRLRKIAVNFYYLRFILPQQVNNATLIPPRDNAPLPQAHSSGKHVNTGAEKNQQVLAIVIHAFYFDIFVRIIEQTRSIDIPYTLYITTHEKIAQEVSSHIKLLGLDAHIKVYENKGRDILPFLKIIQLIKSNGHKVVLKLHTKKSPQKFERGSIWCDSMVHQLLETTIVETVVENFTTHPTIGIIGPCNHLHPLWYKAGNNMPMIKELADTIGFQGDLAKQSFIGGTMFYARVSLFDRLIKMNIQDADFEQEPISTDGTLAHALERFFGLIVSLEKQEVVDTRFIKSMHE